MKRTTTLIAILAIVLTACGGGTEEVFTSVGPSTTQAPVTTKVTTTTQAPVTTTTVRRTTTTTSPVQDVSLSPREAEQFYVMYLHDWSADQALNFIDFVDDSDLINLGYTLCDSFDAGVPVEQVAADFLDAFPDEANQLAAATVVGTAVAAFCPWNGGALG